MLKKLSLIALFCFLTIGFNYPTSAAITYKSANLNALSYPYIQNERFAILALRTLHSAEATYNAISGNGDYGSLDNLRQAEFIDAVLASGNKYGYNFVVQTVSRTTNTPASFFVTATPRSYRKTGRKSFYIDTFGVIRGADRSGAAATANDPEINYECLPYEECAISDLRMLRNAQITYSATNGNGNYGSFIQLYEANLINSSLAAGSHHGYNFTYLTIASTSQTPAFFSLSAVPVIYGMTGRRSFYVDVSGIIRGADRNGAPATANDPPIE